ncbi:MAG TPA: tetratricopeptide repeat protein [Planctomycetota bacterium]|jgi:predicted Zn-dependent protease|nr:tetratricopeptide repeat protein [Planctomycetota bacterium]
MRWLLFVLAQGAAPPAARIPPEARLEAPSVAALQRDPRTLPRATREALAARVAVDAESPAAPPGMHEAVAAIRERDLPRALASLYRVLDATPDFAPAVYEMGVVYFRLQRYGDAAAALERYLEVAPDRVGDTRALGHCYYSLGDYAKAKAHYERVLAAVPKEAEAWRGLALSEMHLGDAAKALEHLDRVLELDPKHGDAWTWKAEILFDADRSEDALAAAEKARDLDRWQPRAWFLLGRILLDMGKEKEGLAAQARYRELASAADRVHTIESSLEYGPHDVALLRSLVELHRSVGNVPAARQALARLVQERPTDVELRIYALDVLEAMGDAEGARTAATAIKQRCAEEGKAWRRLERYYARTGDRLEQARAGEKARRLGSE